MGALARKELADSKPIDWQFVDEEGERKSSGALQRQEHYIQDTGTHFSVDQQFV